MKKINLADLIPMRLFIESEPIAIDLAYQNKNSSINIFKESLYHHDAQLWAHKDIACITLLAARILHKNHNWILEVKDCLRTSDTQTAMQKTDIVKAHPEWMQSPGRLLAPPGAGGHPRAMAIDVCVLNKNSVEVDMGTPFDHLEKEAARDYMDFPEEILNNRQILEDAFVRAAKAFNLPFTPYPAEWWDFRFPYEYFNEYKALSDANLPPQMQMTNKIDNNIPDFDQEHFDKLAQDILYRVNEAI